MRRRQAESGQVLVLTALCMTALLAFLAFAVDVGLLFREKRNLQIAADAAATAGAQNVNYGQSAETAAIEAATANGITGACGASGTQVCVYSPPVDGPNTGASGFVEVVLSEPSPIYFMSLLTGSSTATLQARAVGGTGSNKGCVYTLNTSGTDIGISGSADMNLPGCGIVDDSSSSSALSMSGAGTITANSVSVVGGYSHSGSGTVTPAPSTGAVPHSNPLARLAAPSFNASSCLANPNVSGVKTATLGPTVSGGTVCYNGLSVSGSGSVTLNPGTYVINGSFSISGAATMTGSGVMIYLPSSGDQLSLSGSGAVTLSAPTSGTYTGILFFQDKSDTSSMSLSGASGSSLTGIVYAPKASLTLSGSSGMSLNTSLVVGAVSFSGAVVFSDFALAGSGNPLRSPVLVE